MSVLVTLIRDGSNFFALQPSESSSIQAAETQLGLRFAEDYKEYLLAFGAASFDGRELTGICKSERLSVVSSTARARERYPHFPRKAYVVEDLGFDHVLTVQDRSGIIYEYGPGDSGKVIAESLLQYLFPTQSDV